MAPYNLASIAYRTSPALKSSGGFCSATVHNKQDKKRRQRRQQKNSRRKNRK